MEEEEEEEREEGRERAGWPSVKIRSPHRDVGNKRAQKDLNVFSSGRSSAGKAGPILKRLISCFIRLYLLGHCLPGLLACLPSAEAESQGTGISQQRQKRKKGGKETVEEES